MVVKLLVALVLLLAACGGPNPAVHNNAPEYIRDNLYVVPVEVDGYTVDCVVLDSYKAGGVSCDWYWKG